MKHTRVDDSRHCRLAAAAAPASRHVDMVLLATLQPLDFAGCVPGGARICVCVLSQYDYTIVQQ